MRRCQPVDFRYERMPTNNGNLMLDFMSRETDELLLAYPIIRMPIGRIETNNYASKRYFPLRC